MRPERGLTTSVRVVARERAQVREPRNARVRDHHTMHVGEHMQRPIACKA